MLSHQSLFKGCISYNVHKTAKRAWPWAKFYFLNHKFVYFAESVAVLKQTKSTFRNGVFGDGSNGVNVHLEVTVLHYTGTHEISFNLTI